MRPRLAFNVPHHTAPAADGLELREFRLLIPPDGAAGITVRWRFTAGGAEFGDEQIMALASEELGDLTALEAALESWLATALQRQGRFPSGTMGRAADPVRARPDAPGPPIARLG